MPELFRLRANGKAAGDALEGERVRAPSAADLEGLTEWVPAGERDRLSVLAIGLDVAPSAEGFFTGRHCLMLKLTCLVDGSIWDKRNNESKPKIRKVDKT